MEKLYGALKIKTTRVSVNELKAQYRAILSTKLVTNIGL